MMKKTLLLAFITFLSLSIFADPIDKNTALKVANNYYSVQLKKGQINLTLAYECTSAAYNQQTKSKINQQAYYYVFNNSDQGFIIISGDDAVHPVLGYSDNGSFDRNIQATNFIKWMDNYKNQIRYVMENKFSATAEIKKEWENILKGVVTTKNTKNVDALVQTKWSQSPYVNAMCPYDAEAGEYNDYHAVTGCPATAMAQIMKYWNYPTNGEGFHSYNHDDYGTLSANFASTTYDWAAMPNTVNEANNAVATLMYHCGVAVEMNYGPKSSGSYVILDYTQSPEQCSEYAYKTYFDYDASTIKGLQRENYTDTEWKNMIKADLDAGRPIQYAGFGQGGHTFVCDGYDNFDKFHMNWGWGGNADGFYLLDDLVPGEGGTGSGAGSYNDGQQAIFGIQPANPNTGNGGSTETAYDLVLDANITTSPSSISYNQSFSVTTNIWNKGDADFTGDITAVLFDKDYNVVKFLGTYTNQTLEHGYSYSTPFNVEGSLDYLPGKYYIGYFYEETVDDWVIIDEGDYSQFASFTIENLDDVRLFSEMTVSTGDITQNEGFSVSLNIYNAGSSDFSGKFSVDLHNMDGDDLAVVEEINGMSLHAGNVYTENLEFTSSGIDLEAGTYLLALWYYDNTDSKWHLAGTGDYTNPKKVTVKVPSIQPDKYEDNDTEEKAYLLSANFTKSSASILTTGSNMHNGEDFDYYKLDLPTGYNYTITARAHDSYNSADGNIYTNDVSWMYLQNNVWSDVYDDVMDGKIEVLNGGEIIFSVSSYFIGDKGTYLFDIQVENTGINTSVEEINLADNIKIYPIPAKDFVMVDVSNFPAKVNQLNFVSLSGKKITADFNSNKKLIKLPVTNLSNGAYILTVKTDKGNYQKKVLINKK